VVVAVARTFEAVGVGDGADRFSYPTHRETGISRVARGEINSAKTHLKIDDHDFMAKLQPFVREEESTKPE
jgi:hypothetical protein